GGQAPLAGPPGGEVAVDGAARRPVAVPRVEARRRRRLPAGDVRPVDRGRDDAERPRLHAHVAVAVLREDVDLPDAEHLRRPDPERAGPGLRELGLGEAARAVDVLAV